MKVGMTYLQTLRSGVLQGASVSMETKPDLEVYLFLLPLPRSSTEWAMLALPVPEWPSAEDDGRAGRATQAVTAHVTVQRSCDLLAGSLPHPALPPA